MLRVSPSWTKTQGSNSRPQTLSTLPYSGTADCALGHGKARVQQRQNEEPGVGTIGKARLWGRRGKREKRGWMAMRLIRVSISHPKGETGTLEVCRNDRWNTEPSLHKLVSTFLETRERRTWELYGCHMIEKHSFHVAVTVSF